MLPAKVPALAGQPEWVRVDPYRPGRRPRPRPKQAQLPRRCPGRASWTQACRTGHRKWRWSTAAVRPRQTHWSRRQLPLPEPLLAARFPSLLSEALYKVRSCACLTPLRTGNLDRPNAPNTVYSLRQITRKPVIYPIRKDQFAQATCSMGMMSLRGDSYTELKALARVVRGLSNRNGDLGRHHRWIMRHVICVAQNHLKCVLPGVQLDDRFCLTAAKMKQVWLA